MITNEEKVVQRVGALCKEFQLTFEHWKNLSDLMAEEAREDCKLVVALPERSANVQNVAEYAQIARFAHRNAFVLCAVPAVLDQAAAAFAKKSGADLIIRDEEIFGTGKLEFVALSILKNMYLPIRPGDLAPNLAIEFDLYHFLPTSGKFLKFAFDGDVVSGEKAVKLKTVSALYVHRGQLDRFASYLSKVAAKDPARLADRCRGKFLALYEGYSRLILLLTDQSEHGSFQKGQELLQKCRTMCGELLGVFAELKNVWEIMENTAAGLHDPVERSPAIAAQAGVLALRMGMPGVEDVMLSALLSEVGYVMLPPGITEKIRRHAESELSAEESALLADYPQKGLDLALSRKLSISAGIREVVLSIHENGGGSQKAHAGASATAAQLIGFCQMLDGILLDGARRARRTPDEVAQELIDGEITSSARFKPSFLLKLKPLFSGR